MLIRAAAPADADALVAVLAAEIRGSWRHFGETVPSAAGLAHAIARPAAHPWLVVEVDGAVVGFARATPWKAREAYDWTAEIGVYLARGHHRKGLGKALVTALVQELEDRGFRTLLAGIALPNPASVGLFEAQGFRPIGVLERVGHKHGDWRDVGYWSLHLGDGPPAHRPIPEPDWLPMVQVDAFAQRPFEGNPAAVLRLERWLPDETLAKIARENNLSETAFVVREPRGLNLRWFTPTVEVDLCGHATLAAGFVVLEQDGGDRVDFHTRSGVLTVRRDGARLAMELPSHPPEAHGLPEAIADALRSPPADGWAIKALHHADYFLALYPDAEAVAALAPDTSALRDLGANVICTAPGRAGLDFVSRFFAPASGVDEDPVTGSAHATLTPFWVDRLGRNPLQARQISARGGDVECELVGDRVVLRATCVEVLRGEIRVR